MRKHNQIHTLGALHSKVHFQYLRKFKEFNCSPKNTALFFQQSRIFWTI